MTTETMPAVETTLVVGPASVWIAALDQAVKAAGKHGPRAALDSVYVHARSGVLVFVGTDGFRLHQITTTIKASEGFAERIYSRESVLAALKVIKSVKSRGLVVCELHDDRLEVVSDDSRASTDLVRLDASYPHYEQLMPAFIENRDHDRTHWAVNGRLLADAAELAQRYGHSGIMRMYPAATPSQPFLAVWKSEADEWTARAVIMPMFVDW